MKKFVSFILTMAMVMAMTITAFAAEGSGRVEVEGMTKVPSCASLVKAFPEESNLLVFKKGNEFVIWTAEEVPEEYQEALIEKIEASEYESDDLARLDDAAFACGYETFLLWDQDVMVNADGTILFAGKSTWSWFYYGSYTIIEKEYVWVQTGSDSATGQGSRINAKGCWFMYNTIDTAAMEVGAVETLAIQAGNNKDNIVGCYTVTKTAENTYVIDYAIKELDDTHKIQFDGCHLWVNADGSKFINSPGNQKGNAVAVKPGVAFFFEGDCLNVFAHFNVTYWELQEVVPEVVVEEVPAE